MAGSLGTRSGWCVVPRHNRPLPSNNSGKRTTRTGTAADAKMDRFGGRLTEGGQGVDSGMCGVVPPACPYATMSLFFEIFVVSCQCLTPGLAETDVCVRSPCQTQQQHLHLDVLPHRDRARPKSDEKVRVLNTEAKKKTGVGGGPVVEAPPTHTQNATHGPLPCAGTQERNPAAHSQRDGLRPWTQPTQSNGATQTPTELAQTHPLSSNAPPPPLPAAPLPLRRGVGCARHEVMWTKDASWARAAPPSGDMALTNPPVPPDGRRCSHCPREHEA